MLIPVEAEVDKAVRLLLVVLKPVDNELSPVEVDVDSEFKPVESEFTPLCAVLIPVEVDKALMPVEVEVDKAVTLLLVVLRPVDKVL